MRIVPAVLLWISCGLVGAGFDNAYFQHKYSSICDGRKDLGHALFVGVIGGPIIMIEAFMVLGMGQYGWSLAVHANPRCE